MAESSLKKLVESLTRVQVKETTIFLEAPKLHEAIAVVRGVFERHRDNREELISMLAEKTVQLCLPVPTEETEVRALIAASGGLSSDLVQKSMTLSCVNLQPQKEENDPTFLSQTDSDSHSAPS